MASARRLGSLFGLPGLGRAADCEVLARAASSRCRALAARVVSAHRAGTAQSARQVVAALDGLSATVCSVLDPLELARSVHPEREFAAAADAAYALLAEDLHHLNTSSELHAAVKAAIEKGACTLSTDEQQLARAFLAEFEQDGAHLEGSSRHQLQELHSAAATACSRFVAAARSPPPAGSTASAGVWVPSESLRRAPASLISYTREHSGRRHVRAHHGLLTEALCYCEDGESRRALYSAREGLGVHALPQLEEMLGARDRLARAAGHASYAGYAFAGGDRVATSAEQVICGLATMCDDLMPAARSEMRRMVARAARDGITLPDGEENLPPWHVEYYTRRIEQEDCDERFGGDTVSLQGGHGLASTALGEPSDYLELGDCLHGLCKILQHAFGLTLVRVPAVPGELWHPTVVKMLLCKYALGLTAEARESFGTATGEFVAPNPALGVLYLDLFTRPGKPGGAAVYTLRVAVDDTASLGEVGNSGVGAEDGVHHRARSAAGQAGQHGEDGDSSLFLHLPAAALVADLSMPRNEMLGDINCGEDVNDERRVLDASFSSTIVSDSSLISSRTREGTSISKAQPRIASDLALLSPHQLRTLYHEVGHALHALLSRSPSHHLGGLRVAQDFLEVPSTLMESFVSSPHALTLWAKHASLRHGIPSMAASAIAHATSAETFGSAIRLQLDAVSAMFDLQVHRVSPAPSAAETTRILADLRRRYTLQPIDEKSAAPHANFVHLGPYGGAYYSYLFARSLATRVWHQAGFAEHALSGAAGRAWIEKVLKYGGSRPSRLLLKELLKPCASVKHERNDASKEEDGHESSSNGAVLDTWDGGKHTTTRHHSVVQKAMLRLVQI